MGDQRQNKFFLSKNFLILKVVQYDNKLAFQQFFGVWVMIVRHK